jgi:hypothetical protein
MLLDCDGRATLRADHISTSDDAEYMTLLATYTALHTINSLVTRSKKITILFIDKRAAILLQLDICL